MLNIVPEVGWLRLSYLTYLSQFAARIFHCSSAGSATSPLDSLYDSHFIHAIW